MQAQYRTFRIVEKNFQTHLQAPSHISPGPSWALKPKAEALDLSLYVRFRIFQKHVSGLSGRGGPTSKTTSMECYLAEVFIGPCLSSMLVWAWGGCVFIHSIGDYPKR